MYFSLKYHKIIGEWAKQAIYSQVKNLDTYTFHMYVNQIKCIHNKLKYTHIIAKIIPALTLDPELRIFCHL